MYDVVPAGVTGVDVQRQGRLPRALLTRRIARPMQLATDTPVRVVRQAAVDADDPEQRIRRVGTRALRIGDVVTGGRRRTAADRDDQRHHNDDEPKRRRRHPPRSGPATARRRHKRQATTRLGMRGEPRAAKVTASATVRCLGGTFNRLRSGLSHGAGQSSWSDPYGLTRTRTIASAYVLDVGARSHRRRRTHAGPTREQRDAGAAASRKYLGIRAILHAPSGPRLRRQARLR